MVAAVRLRKLQQEDGALELDWRSFLLRPTPAEKPRTLEEFRAYTESWRRAAAEEPAAGFRVWSTDEGPPSHSLPPHLVAKAAAELGAEAFERVHELLLRAYFQDNLDITSKARLLEIWRRAELPESAAARWQAPELVERIAAEHREALEHGAGGVPAVRLGGHFGVVTGAHPLDAYRQWLHRARAATAVAERRGDAAALEPTEAE